MTAFLDKCSQIADIAYRLEPRLSPEDDITFLSQLCAMIFAAKLNVIAPSEAIEKGFCSRPDINIGRPQQKGFRKIQLFVFERFPELWLTTKFCHSIGH